MMHRIFSMDADSMSSSFSEMTARGTCGAGFRETELLAEQRSRRCRLQYRNPQVPSGCQKSRALAAARYVHHQHLTKAMLTAHDRLSLDKTIDEERPAGSQSDERLPKPLATQQHLLQATKIDKSLIPEQQSQGQLPSSALELCLAGAARTTAAAAGERGGFGLVRQPPAAAECCDDTASETGSSSTPRPRKARRRVHPSHRQASSRLRECPSAPVMLPPAQEFPWTHEAACRVVQDMLGGTQAQERIAAAAGMRSSPYPPHRAAKVGHGVSPHMSAWSSHDVAAVAAAVAAATAAATPEGSGEYYSPPELATGMTLTAGAEGAGRAFPERPRSGARVEPLPPLPDLPGAELEDTAGKGSLPNSGVGEWSVQVWPTPPNCNLG